MFVYLILSLLELVGGYLYPIYASLLLISATQNFSGEEFTRWGSYWLTFALLNKFAFEILSILPSALSTVLLFIRVLVILYLVLPQTRGSEVVWNKFFRNEEMRKKFKSSIGEFAGSINSGSVSSKPNLYTDTPSQ